jgi:hypothetical protein
MGTFHVGSRDDPSTGHIEGVLGSPKDRVVPKMQAGRMGQKGN